ncbi:CoA transferase [Streptomyces reniochalinae]|uniref:CoA transferase n=1 Tax=Streptomyces reniochalinae TaxID=2250578 RepID=UPI001FE817E0|nr:CoA transferase [Streptomyces reniochalinae]
MREYPAYDLIVQAMSGLMAATGTPDRPVDGPAVTGEGAQPQSGLGQEAGHGHGHLPIVPQAGSPRTKPRPAHAVRRGPWPNWAASAPAGHVAFR